MARLTKEGQLLHDLTVKFQVYLERLKAGEMRRIDSTIRDFDEAMKAAMVELGEGPSRRKLERVLKALRVQMESLSDVQLESYLKTLKKFSKYAMEYTTETINTIAPPGSPALTPASAASWAAALEAPIQATGDTLQSFIKDWSDSTIKKVEGAVRTGFAQGQTNAEIVRRIRGTKANNFKDGILGGITKREANAMVRTSLQHVSAQAQQTVYDDNSDIISGYIWISTLDSRTTTQCKGLDSKEFQMGKGPIPPIHIGCRSTTIPKIAGVDLLGETTRASEDGQVPATTTYYSWLKTQSTEFQNDALGVTRATLFRKGGLSADEFSRLSLDKNFEPLTLEEMKLKNPAAFQRAGI